MKKIKYYPQKDLLLKADVPGAKMWAVALNKAMLTYFEIEPNSKFDMHSHKSEQITMVLHGELFFEIADEETICVKTGEVIAIPSNIKHSVYTQKNRVKAIDAWSPIRKEYIRTLKIQKATATDSENILEVQKLAYQSEAERYNDYNIPPLKQTIDELKRQFKTHIFLKAISDEKSLER
jgi:quercetin dioxygenase-like cupin family protein